MSDAAAGIKPQQTFCVRMASRKPNVTLSIQKKVEVIQAMEQPGAKFNTVGEAFGIDGRTVRRLVKAKESIFKQVVIAGNRKRQRRGDLPEVEDALLVWFRIELSKGARLSGEVMRDEARRLAAEFGVKNFTASSGWLARFKARHGIIFRREHGEKAVAELAVAPDLSECEAWLRDTLPGILAEFGPQDIFHADETDIFFRRMPNQSFTVKATKLAGGKKKAKERVTAVVCANMDGSERCPLLVIGKSQQPRFFPADTSQLPVVYRSNSNVEMTGALWTEWLREWDRQCRVQDRHICVLVNTCSAHPANVELTNIRQVFLPSSATGPQQPMAMGVIQKLKFNYSAKLNCRILASLADSDVEIRNVVMSVSLLDALHLLAQAWADVQPDAIQNAFKRGGFIHPVTVGGAGEGTYEQTWEAGAECQVTEQIGEEALQVIEMGEEIPTKVEPTGVQQVKQETRDAPDEEGAEERVTARQALYGLSFVRRYVQSEGLLQFYDTVAAMEDMLANKIMTAKRQKCITDYFKQS